jgi:hypothetical protein
MKNLASFDSSFTAEHLPPLDHPISHLLEDAMAPMPVKDTGLGHKMLRTGEAIVEGTVGGIGETLAGYAKNPLNALEGVAIGVGTTAAFLASKNMMIKAAVPLVFGASATVELYLKEKDIRAGLSGAWNGTMSVDDAAQHLHPLGHLALTYAIAKGTNAYGVGIAKIMQRTKAAEMLLPLEKISEP